MTTQIQKATDWRKAVSHSRLLALLNYDPHSGIFRWRANGKGRKYKRACAGRLAPSGYREICIDSRLYYAGRLAWFYMTGVWPLVFVDHKDHRRDNNAFTNLRPATAKQNQANRIGASKYGKGVRLRPSGKYTARLRGQHLGTFTTVKAARAAFLQAAQQQHGEFAYVGS